MLKEKKKKILDIFNFIFQLGLLIIGLVIIFFLHYYIFHIIYNTYNSLKKEEMIKENIKLRTIAETGDDTIYVYIDKETGVNYIIYKGFGKAGICPRYNQDGSIYISK